MKAFLCYFFFPFLTTFGFVVVEGFVVLVVPEVVLTGEVELVVGAFWASFEVHFNAFNVSVA